MTNIDLDSFTHPSFLSDISAGTALLKLVAKRDLLTSDKQIIGTEGQILRDQTEQVASLYHRYRLALSDDCPAETMKGITLNAKSLRGELLVAINKAIGSALSSGLYDLIDNLNQLLFSTAPDDEWKEQNDG